MDDAMIVQLYWDRDEQAIPITAEKCGGYCTAIAKNILTKQEDAEECVNDTYLHAWNAMPPHRPHMLSTFLGKITRNLSLNRYKHNATDKRGGGQMDVVWEELAEVVSDGSSAETELERWELVRAIDAFLDSLPFEKRGVLVCRYWYYDSIPSIAKRYGMTENHVSVLLHRLRRKLHKYLTERGFEL